MITVDYARTMATYNAWQNRSIYTAAATLSEAARREDRGAFFGSIHRTLSHLLWADQMWLARFAGTAKPAAASIPESPDMVRDWNDLTAERHTLDDQIVGWAEGLDKAWLYGDLSWYSGAAGREITKPRALLLVHFFNHQTHHRGQVHAMLTAAGARPGDTDLPFMPTPV